MFSSYRHNRGMAFLGKRICYPTAALVVAWVAMGTLWPQDPSGAPRRTRKPVSVEIRAVGAGGAGLAWYYDPTLFLRWSGPGPSSVAALPGPAADVPAPMPHYLPLESTAGWTSVLRADPRPPTHLLSLVGPAFVPREPPVFSRPVKGEREVVLKLSPSLEACGLRLPESGIARLREGGRPCTLAFRMALDSRGVPWLLHPETPVEDAELNRLLMHLLWTAAAERPPPSGCEGRGILRVLPP